MKKYIFKITIIILIILNFTFLLNAEALSVDNTSSFNEIKGLRAKIINIEEREDYQLLKLEVLDRKNKNHILNAEFYPTHNFYGIKLRKNDEVFVNIEIDENNKVKYVTIANVARDKYILNLLWAFIILLLLIGGFKGLRSIISLILSYFLIIKIMLPLIIKGYDPIYTTLVLCSIITAVTLLLIGGFNKKLSQRF